MPNFTIFIIEAVKFNYFFQVYQFSPLEYLKSDLFVRPDTIVGAQEARHSDNCTFTKQ